MIINANITKISRNVDWLTCTSKNDKVGLAWLDALNSTITDRDRKLKRDWRWRMYAGFSINGCRWGFDSQVGYILILTRDRAAGLWPIIFSYEPYRVTRLDLQATVYLDKPEPELVNKQFIQTKALWRKGQPRPLLIDGGKWGKTLYIGSRSSMQYGRIYDKGLESKSKMVNPGQIWRYEVEFKKPMSQPVAAMLIEKTHTIAIDHILIGDIVWRWFKNRNVNPVFNRYSDIPEVSLSYQETTLDRKIAWLRTQVAPTVVKLIDAGAIKEVKEALGLDWYDWGN